MNIKPFLNLQSANFHSPEKFDATRTTDSPTGLLVRAVPHSFAIRMAAHAGALMTIVIAAVLLLLSPQTASAQGKTILILAPHPDDEGLCCSSIISAAKAAGNTVKIVVVTNGDDYASPASASLGYLREAETVDAMSLLGVNESDIIFLGYGDQDLQTPWQSISTTSISPSPAGQSQTYANRGLGHVDYHTFLTGSPAPYNQASILADFEAVIQNLQPDEIYTTGLIDIHPDHSGTYSFLSKALIILENQGLAKIPRVHEMTIHDPCDSCNPSYKWPNPVFSPGQPFPLPPYLTSLTQYQWNQIESIPVVPSMQDPSQSTNLKERVIAQYASQTSIDPTNWLFSFVKKNEFFWIQNFPTNLAPLATVSVSSETPASGQLGIKAVDQRIGGNPYPNATDAEWASNGELAGAWIKLTWPNPVTISQIVLYDRPNLTDNVLSGTLSFSDGSSIPVGALPPNGDSALTSFAAKTVTWVQFTVNTAEGGSVGLSEFEVFGKLATSTTNHAPQLYQSPVADSENLSDGSATHVNATAFDVDGDTLTYTWTTDAGTISGSGPSVVFNPPAVSASTVVTITLTVSDGQGGSIQSSEFVTVSSSGATGISASSLVLNPTSVTSSSTSTGTVTLNTAPPAGAVLTLSSDTPSAATVPATLTIPPGSLTGNFTVSSDFVSSSTLVTISASLGATANATLTVTPPASALSSFSVNPTTVGGSISAIGTVTLTSPAPIGGAVVTLSSGLPLVASVPVTVTVPAGSTSATFPVTTSPVTDPTSVPLTASLGGVISQTTLRVGVYVPSNLATLAAVSVSSETPAYQQLGVKAIDGIVDGSPTGDYTKEWSSNGELAGAWIRLTWSNPLAVSSLVLYDRTNLTDNITSGTLSFSDGSTVPVGALPNAGDGLTVSFSSRTVTWVQFTVNSAVGQNIGLAEIAAYGPNLSGVTLNPSTMTGGDTSTGTVILGSPAPVGGATVALSASNPLAQPHTIQPVHYSGALQADASIPWASLGPPYYATVPNGVVATVSGVSGLTATITNNAMQPLYYNIECPGDLCDWVGFFNPGAGVLWDSGTYQPDGSWLGNGPMTIAFSSPQRGLGFQIMPDEYGPYTATMCAYDSSHTPLGCTSFSGSGAGAPADFVGIYDDTQEISTVTIDAGGALYPHDFAIGDAFVVSGEKQLATVPATVTVPAGATTATFPITTSQVSSTTPLTISATYGATQTATLTLTSPVLSSVVMNANTVPGGTSSTGTVTLASPAPTGGALVTLTSDVPVAQPHTIQATTYPTSLQPNGSVTPAALQPDGVVNWSTLGPAYFTNIDSGTVLPVSGIPGLNVTLTNTQNQPLQYDLQCPAFDCLWIGNFNPGADLLWDSGTYQPDGSWLGNGPMTVTFSSPQRGLGTQIMPDEFGAFTATMCAYDSSNTQLGCASFSGAGSVNNQAIPIGIYDDTQEISKVTIDAGGALYPHDFAIGDMFVASAARPVVATVPASVTVPAGQTTGTFNVTTTGVNTNTFVSITGSYSGTQATGTMQVTAIAPTVSTVSFSPASVAGGSPSTGTVTLTSPAVLGGAVVTLTSDNAAVTVPVSVAVAAHATTANFNANTTAVGSGTTATITATIANSAPQTGTLTLGPLAVSSVTLSPTTVQGGSANSTATVTLNGVAPAGGVSVALTSSITSAATVPSTVSISAGSSSTTFTVTSQTVGAQATPIITASYNNSSAMATLTVNPPAVTTVALNPTTVVSQPSGTGSTSTGTVTLNAIAPTGGAIVALTSSNTGVATVPASVTVPSGSSSTTFTVTSVDGQSSMATASISASTVGGGTQSATLTVIPSASGVATLTLNPTTVQGGLANSTATVTLNGPAPIAGASVTLADNSAATTVPATVTVPANATSTTFTVTSVKVGAQTISTISATYDGVQQTAALTVNPPTVTSVVLNPTSITSQTSGTASTSTGTVTLNASAPAGGVVVTLASSNTAVATVPATVTVAQSSTTATFTVTSIDGQTSTATSSISASLTGGGSQSATLTVTPQATGVASLTLNPTTVTGGVANSTATVTLNGNAPIGGAVVTLSSSITTAATVPVSVTVASNTNSATFTVTSHLISAPAAPVITATYNSVPQTTTLTVNALTVSSLTLNPTTVQGGSANSTATVTLTDVAPAGGAVVTLSSSITGAATVPATTTVAAGSSTKTFTVTSVKVAAQATPIITAAYNSSNQTSTLTVNPPAITSLTLNPTSITSQPSGVASTSTGTVTLNATAPAGGVVVTLASSNTAAATVPATVTVAQNSTTATFTVTSINGLTVTATSSISASLTGGGTQSATLTVVNGATGVATLTLNPTSVQGGSANSTATVTLDGAAPTAGAIVTLASNSASATVPLTVTVAANTTSKTFTVTSVKVGAQTPATISATYSSVQQTAILTVNPPAISSVGLNPTSLLGGANSTATVTLNATAPIGGVVVNVASGNTAAATLSVSTVTVPAGSTSTTFTVTSIPVAATSTSSISATLTGGGTQSATLTVNPPTLSSLALNPTTVTHPASSTGTVTISGAAPAGGFVVNLSSSSPSATVDPTMTIAAGQTSGTFTISTNAAGPAPQHRVTISASKTGSTTRTATLTVN